MKERPSLGKTAAPIAVKDLKRVCRMYRTSRDAAAALGTNITRLLELGKEHGVETPAERVRREKNARMPGAKKAMAHSSENQPE